MKIPRNYGGSAFSESTRIPTPVENKTRSRVHYGRPEMPSHDEPITEPEAREMPPENQSENECRACENECPCIQQAQKKSPLLSPLGELGTEEILLIALALIIFQNGKDPDLALILLALLFF